MTWPAVWACLQDGGEVAGKAGAFERVGVAAFGQQPDAADRREQEPVQESVGELDGGGVAAQLGLGDVPDDRDVRARWRARARCGSAARAAVRPTQSAASGDSVEISRLV